MKISAEKRDAIIKVAGGFLLGLAVLYWFGVRGQEAEFARLANLIDEARGAAEKASIYVKSGNAVFANLQAARARLEQEEAGLAPIESSYRRDWMLQEINNAIRASGVPLDLDSFTLLEPADVNAELLPKFPFSATRFRVKMTGYFGDFGKFLADFENHFPYIRVQDFLIKPAEAVSTGIEVATEPTSTQTTQAREVQVSEKLSFEFVIVSLIKTLSTP